MKTIALQGIQGSYHHQVACEYFGDNQLWNECLTFDALAKSLHSGESDFAVMALENSIAGSIIPNYALIDQYDLHIVGEHYLNIHHQLMALPGTTLSDISEVASHPMALLQCKDFFLIKIHTFDCWRIKTLLKSLVEFIQKKYMGLVLLQVKMLPNCMGWKL
jgi:prephenate dehydratase